MNFTLLPVDFSAITVEHIVLALFCYLVVFLSLFMLALLFSIMPQLCLKKLKHKGNTATCEHSMVQGEVSAAIAMALSNYFDELHDQETTILTIKNATKSYSPWSSKIYNVLNLNRFQR